MCFPPSLRGSKLNHGINKHRVGNLLGTEEEGQKWVRHQSRNWVGVTWGPVCFVGCSQALHTRDADGQCLESETKQGPSCFDYCYYFCDNGNETQGLVHAWQVLYPLSYVPSLQNALLNSLLYSP